MGARFALDWVTGPGLACGSQEHAVLVAAAVLASPPEDADDLDATSGPRRSRRAIRYEQEACLQSTHTGIECASEEAWAFSSSKLCQPMIP